MGGDAHPNERRSESCLETLKMQYKEDGWEGERVDRLRTERHPGVCYSERLESDGVKG